MNPEMHTDVWPLALIAAAVWVLLGIQAWRNR